jgi:hypothetical protein
MAYFSNFSNIPYSRHYKPLPKIKLLLISTMQASGIANREWVKGKQHWQSTGFRAMYGKGSGVRKIYELEK